jgi:hypothetical protein
MDAGMLEEKKRGRSEISLSLPMLCLAHFLNIATAVSFSYFTLRSISMDATLGHFDKYCTSSVESASPLLRHQDNL